MARRRQTSHLHGLIVVDKPIGLSSMDVVRRVRRAAGGCRTGHAGALDPLATGVVICCLGTATKHVERLMSLAKTYEAAIDLSAFSTTDDLEGELEPVSVAHPPTRRDIEDVIAGFIGMIEQTPPAHSAVHVGGRRAYELARRGEAVVIDPRPVRIDEIDLLRYDWPALALRVTCGRGTYIRSLARDIGTALHTGGHLTALRRNAVGPYHVEQAHPIERFDRPIAQDDLLTVE